MIDLRRRCFQDPLPCREEAGDPFALGVCQDRANRRLNLFFSLEPAFHLLGNPSRSTNKQMSTHLRAANVSGVSTTSLAPQELKRPKVYVVRAIFQEADWSAPECGIFPRERVKLTSPIGSASLGVLYPVAKTAPSPDSREGDSPPADSAVRRTRGDSRRGAARRVRSICLVDCRRLPASGT
jgi:hypothetical protein